MDVHHQNTVVAVKESRVIKSSYVFKQKDLDSNSKSPTSPTVQANERPNKDFMSLGTVWTINHVFS
jgi:hypothetical protein